MFKKLVYGSVLAACCSFAHADNAPLSKYEFTWKGFETYPFPGFDPNYTVSGTFAGIDANHNNILELNELTDLKIQGTEFVGCQAAPGDSCGVSMFSYSQQDGLQLHAGRTVYFSPPGPDDWSAFSQTYHLEKLTPTSFSYVDYTSFGRMYYESGGGIFTPQTVMTVTAAVPEPQTWLMLGAGMLLLSQASKRRKRS